MALPKFSQPTISSNADWPKSASGAPDQGPIDRPNPLLNKAVYQNNNVFGGPAQNQSAYFPHVVNGSVGYQPPVHTMPVANTSAFSPQPGQPYRPIHYPAMNAPRTPQMAQFPVQKSSPLYQRSLAPKPQSNNTDRPAGIGMSLNRLNWKSFALNSFLIILTSAVAVTGYFYFTRTGSSVSADVAGAATSSEVIANIADNAIVPSGTPQIFKIDNVDAVKQKDTDFFSSVQTGDYLLLYTGKSVLYRPSAEKIVAVTDKEIR